MRQSPEFRTWNHSINLCSHPFSILAFVGQLTVFVESVVYRSLLYQHAQNLPITRAFLLPTLGEQIDHRSLSEFVRSFRNEYGYQSSAPISPSASARGRSPSQWLSIFTPTLELSPLKCVSKETMWGIETGYVWRLTRGFASLQSTSTCVA